MRAKNVKDFEHREGFLPSPQRSTSFTYRKVTSLSTQNLRMARQVIKNKAIFENLNYPTAGSEQTNFFKYSILRMILILFTHVFGKFHPTYGEKSIPYYFCQGVFALRHNMD